MLAAARDRFGTALTMVVNNALADFPLNGDARAKAAEIGGDAFPRSSKAACMAR